LFSKICSGIECDPQMGMRMASVKITSAIITIALTFSLASLTGCGDGSTASTPVQPSQPVTPTGPASGSEFIYSINFASELQVAPLNPTTGEIGAAVVATQNILELPEEAVAAQFGNFIYLVGFDQYQATTAVWIFSISGASGELTLIDGSPFHIAGAANPYYNLLMDSQHGRFFTAGMAQGPDGFVDVFQINQYSINPGNGELNDANQLVLATTTQGWIIDPVIDPLGKFIYADGSSPEGSGIFAFTIDPTAGDISQIAGSPFPAATSSATSDSNVQLLTSPSGNSLNVITAGDTYVFAIDPNSGALTAIPGSPFPNNDTLGTPAVMTPNNEFMFVGAELPLASGGYSPIIQTFAVDSGNGTIGTTPLSDPTSAGVANEFMQIDPTGRVLIAPDIPSVWSFTINQSAGALTSVAGSPFTLPGDPFGAQQTLIVKIP
jgi:hypothetical protein